jgi:uncharacterized protein (DUF305 family)
MKALQIVFIALIALVLAGCAAQAPGSTGSATHSTQEHEHSSNQATDVPYDAQFIDGMIIHHQGAVAMAEQALQESQRPEIRQLAEAIIATQSQEIEQMTSWRQQWYSDVPITEGTGAHMGDMELSADTSIPFDQRFITAMIGHHDGAIEMAREAQTKAEHEEIRQLAAAIIQAQEAEVEQLQAWQRAWFNQ